MSRISSAPVMAGALVLLLAGAAALGWLWLRDGRVTPTAIIVMTLPLGLLLAGVFAGGNDRSQLGTMAWGCTMFAAMIPAYYVLQSGPANWFLQWRFMAGYGVLYLAMLLPFLLWVAAWSAWVPPAPGTMPLSEHRLKQRVQSLTDAGLGLRIERPSGEADQMLVTRDFRDGKRTIGVRLTFVSHGHCVRAREVSLIRGDKPTNASEAQMRGGPRRRDGVHPDADLIYDASLTVTPASETIRRQIALRITDDRVEDVSGNAVAAAPENLAHLLTELVHQSGWGWQGVFFDWQRGCRGG